MSWIYAFISAYSTVDPLSSNPLKLSSPNRSLSATLPDIFAKLILGPLASSWVLNIAIWGLADEVELKLIPAVELYVNVLSADKADVPFPVTI